MSSKEVRRLQWKQLMKLLEYFLALRIEHLFTDNLAHILTDLE